jgi:hypothetical protein
MYLKEKFISGGSTERNAIELRRGRQAHILPDTLFLLYNSKLQTARNKNTLESHENQKWLRSDR